MAKNLLIEFDNKWINPNFIIMIMPNPDWNKNNVVVVMSTGSRIEISKLSVRQVAEKLNYGQM